MPHNIKKRPKSVTLHHQTMARVTHYADWLRTTSSLCHEQNEDLIQRFISLVAHENVLKINYQYLTRRFCQSLGYAHHQIEQFPMNRWARKHGSEIDAFLSASVLAC
jgi:hypothetical protein